MTEITREAIGRRLRCARKTAGMSGTEVGRRLAVPCSHAAISDWERGVVRQDVLALAELATIYDVTLRWIIWGDDTVEAMGEEGT